MAGLVFPNDAGEINYALCMGHNYTNTDPFHRLCSGTLCPCLEFQIIHQHIHIFLSLCALFIHHGCIFISLCLTLGKYEKGYWILQSDHVTSLTVMIWNWPAILISTCKKPPKNSVLRQQNAMKSIMHCFGSKPLFAILRHETNCNFLVLNAVFHTLHACHWFNMWSSYTCC